MKKLIISILVLLNAIAYAKPIVIVSVLPEKTFTQKIAKDKVDVTVMVEPGSSPHSYEPKPSQMVAISKAQIYFSVGVEFEEAWLERFKSQNPNLKFLDISSGVSKIQMGEGHHHQDEGHEKRHHDELDPHTWTSPKNVSVMAHAIYKALAELDPENKEFYKSNLNDFIKEIKDADAQIRDALKDLEPKSKFMVFHPSWGYFANEYDLVQIAVEVEGKKPKPKEMIAIIKEAKEEKVKVIFAQPEFSDKSARIIAKEAKVSVKKISPLNPDWSQNLIDMAKAIADK
jgi:zinc transport system substrate-binding protein